jgi:hypothetical protein
MVLHQMVKLIYKQQKRLIDMAKINGSARILPFKRRKTPLEKISLIVLILNIVQISGIAYILFHH